MTTDTDTLVARLRTLPPCQAHNLEAADRIAALEAEVARCHARLEITHVGQMKGDGTADLIRVEVPMAERATMPDGIDARDATIYLLDEDIARLSASLVAEVTESEALRAQLTEARVGEDELREALAQYANPDLYRSHPHGLAFDRRDKSYIAIAALASHDKRKEGRTLSRAKDMEAEPRATAQEKGGG